MIRSLRQTKGAKVGYPSETTGGQTYPNGLTLAQNAAFQHFGTEHIPPRPFMDTGPNEVVRRPQAIARALRLGLTTNSNRVNAEIGLVMKTEIQRGIRDGGWDPNAPSTVARKGSSAPLIDTGRLRQGVDSIPKR